MFRVLVVDDNEPFRQFACALLQQRNELQVIGKASDGLEAVQKAQELRPDLILLDIGLPKLNGIQAARRLRDFLPRAKILFLSVESSSDVVRQALNSGGVGYVHKLRAQSELLPAIAAVLGGKQFVSSNIEGWEYTESTAAQALPHHHEMLIYSDDAILLESFTLFIATALRADNPAIVIATKSHLDSLFQSLKAEGLDVAAATERGAFVPLDVTETLSTFMVNDLPDPVRFMDAATDLIQAAKVAKGVHARIAACGACAPRLWAEGKTDAAVWVERLWDDLGKAHELDILCAYPSSGFPGGKDARSFKIICAHHSAVYSR
jgi:DNA-binding NarL/FixJ family response regulator